MQPNCLWENKPILLNATQGVILINIHICTSTYYSYQTIAYIVNHISVRAQSAEKLSIFTFEDTWVNEEEFEKLRNCVSNRILIIAKEKTIDFIAACIHANDVSYTYLDASVTTLINTIHAFMYNKEDAFLFKKNHPSDMTKKEYRVMSLYLNEVPVIKISQVLRVSTKRVYAIKSEVMRKTYLSTDAGLVKQWRLVKKKLAKKNVYRSDIIPSWSARHGNTDDVGSINS